jgi:hypothetical protein
VQKPEPLLDKAKQQEKKYNWLEAADLYEQASSLASKDLAKAAELRERIGYCFLRAAFQAETNEQFRGRMEQSVKAYEKTAELNHKTEEEDKEAKIFHAKAMAAYVSGRRSPDIQQRRTLLDEWFKFENKALEIYEKIGDPLSIGRTYNNLAEWSMERQHLESRWLALKNSMLECVSFGEKAIKALSQVEDEHELARAYTWIVYHFGTASHFKAIDIDEQVGQKLRSYITKAGELSKNVGDAYLKSITAIMKARAEDPDEILEGFRNVAKYGTIAKDNYRMGYGNAFLSGSLLMTIKEDPDKQREEIKEAMKIAQGAIRQLSIIDDYSVRFTAYNTSVLAGKALADIEPDFEKKRSLLETAVEDGRENLRNMEGETVWYSVVLFLAFSNALFALSEIETKVDNKRRLLQEALIYREKLLDAMQRSSPFDYWVYSMGYTVHVLILVELAKMEKGKKRNELFKKAVSSMEKCVQLIEKDKMETQMGYATVQYGLTYYSFGGILEQLHSLTKDKRHIERAIETYKAAIKYFSKVDLTNRVAESYWQIARLKNHLGDNLESAQNYLTAAENYRLAAEQIPNLKNFYGKHSDYMQAWSEIENAKQSHKTEEYEQAKSHYEKAANLHKMSELWSYLAPNYLAWAQMEKAEDHSRKDETQQAMETFKQARDYFKKSEDSLQTKLKEITATDEKSMVTKLIKSSDIRQRYCQARISIEEAKIFDRNGKYGLSARSYGLATEKLKQIIEETDYEQPLKELKQIMILSQAWQKMAQAEEKTSPELYLEAAQLFEQANKHSLTKKTSLLALGNSSFCKGLAAGTKFQNTLDVEMHSEAKGYIKSAATYYLKAGFKAASEYAKATQRLFDAYLYMNSAERETDPEKSAKYYHMAEKVLQISVESFMEAKQPEKKAEVQRILETVKEERELAVSLNEVLHAPTITSATAAFTTPTPTSEESVGLERFEHADVQANLIASVKDVKVGESFCLSVEFVNAGKEPALLTRVEDFVPQDFVVVKKPEIYRIDDTTLNMKGKQLAPLKLVEVKLTLQPSKKGQYQLNPIVHYLDELGHNKSLQLKTLEIKVEEVILEDRISTGTQELDSLLLGGIPKEYAVVLAGPPCDERELLIKNFLKSGTKEGITFSVTTEATGLEGLLDSPYFFLFLCNPKPKTPVPDLPNVYKLHGKTDLTNLSIALLRAYRNVEHSSNKRVCINIVSDVLVVYGVKTTREWIAELTTDLISKDFTVLAVINPLMHTSEELNSILDLFDGEISLYETKDPMECKKSLRVKKLRNQDYIKNPICLTNHI